MTTSEGISMNTRAGIVGYLGRDVDPAHVAAGLGRAPWRGAVSGSIRRPFGAIFALGAAQAGNCDHVGVVLHGRIDNEAELAKDLGVDAADTCGLLAAAYLRYGDEFANRVLGDFALLVLDERRHALLGVRDWGGARPLFWGTHAEVVAFGSEVKQVLAVLDRPYELDEATATAYARMQDLPVATAFAKGVEAVAPSGQVLATLASPPRATVRHVEFTPHKLSLPEIGELLRTRFDTAVARRLRDATRPSALISGGMDSTTCAATAAALATRGITPPLVAGISLHFPDVPASDEIAYSRAVIERWNIPWYPVVIAPENLTSDPSALLALHDGPVYPGIQMFDRMYAEAARHSADVLLSGQGGDVWQDQYFNELAFCLLRREWRAAGGWLVHGIRTRPKSTAKRLALAARARALRRSLENDHFVEVGTRYWTIRMAYETEERLGQFYGLRVEFPFLDRELAEAMVGISPALRSNRDMSKLPLREAMVDRLPAAIVQRQDKSFFDPVMVRSFGTPPPGWSAARMVAEHYVATWRKALADVPSVPDPANSGVRSIDFAREISTIGMGPTAHDIRGIIKGGTA
jgi:asparagine synthase (glutamine-hydrolysing)